MCVFPNETTFFKVFHLPVFRREWPLCCRVVPSIQQKNSTVCIQISIHIKHKFPSEKALEAYILAMKKWPKPAIIPLAFIHGIQTVFIGETNGIHSLNGVVKNKCWLLGNVDQMQFVIHPSHYRKKCLPSRQIWLKNYKNHW